jgi:protein-disulfide isomerase
MKGDSSMTNQWFEVSKDDLGTLPTQSLTGINPDSVLKNASTSPTQQLQDLVTQGIVKSSGAPKIGMVQGVPILTYTFTIDADKLQAYEAQKYNIPASKASLLSSSYGPIVFSKNMLTNQLRSIDGTVYVATEGLFGGQSQSQGYTFHADYTPISSVSITAPSTSTSVASLIQGMIPAPVATSTPKKSASSVSVPSTHGTSVSSQTSVQQNTIATVESVSDPYVGDANAPVTMLFFSDYQCPYCRQFVITTMPDLYSNYVKTGKLKVVFKDFDFLGSDSTIASEFALSVWTLYPEKFYQWYNIMFQNQVAENADTEEEYLAHLKKITANIPAIDVNTVVANMNTNIDAYDANISADITEGQNDGVQGTPTLIIGTTVLEGAQSYDALAAIIDSQSN